MFKYEYLVSNYNISTLNKLCPLYEYGIGEK